MTDSVAVSPAPSFPRIRTVGFDAIPRWLGLGWDDLWRQPSASLFYGVAIAVTGAVILGVTANLPYLFAAAITGFLLVSPLMAAGLYELSRRYLVNEPATLSDSMAAWWRNPAGLLGFGLLSMLAGTAWQLLSAVIVAVFYQGPPLGPVKMMIEVLINPKHYLMFFIYMGSGGLMAAVVFALSVVSMPMLLDRRGDLVTAVITSVNAVAENPLTLACWAFVIMVLTGLGFATALFGLVLVVPWLGHASFHAYKDLVE